MLTAMVRMMVEISHAIGVLPLVLLIPEHLALAFESTQGSRLLVFYGYI